MQRPYPGSAFSAQIRLVSFLEAKNFFTFSVFVGGAVDSPRIVALYTTNTTIGEHLPASFCGFPVEYQLIEQTMSEAMASYTDTLFEAARAHLQQQLTKADRQASVRRGVRRQSEPTLVVTLHNHDNCSDIPKVLASFEVDTRFTDSMIGV